MTDQFNGRNGPVTVRDAKGRETEVAVDEGPRRDSTAEALARLKPAFALPDGRHGLATLCLGGGGSVAAAFERVT